MYRQGDVLVAPTEHEIPEGTKVEDRCILAYGEKTGHCHQIETGAHLFVEVDGVRYLDVFDDEATITHEEHGAITLPRGRYTVTIQREYTPDEVRQVVD